MTALDHGPAVYRPGDDDFWSCLLPEAAGHAIDCGYASASLLHRRMRLGHDDGTAQQLLDELADAGIVGPEGPNHPTLVDHAQAAAILAGLADPDQPPNQPAVVDLDDDAIEATNQVPIALTKPTSQPAATLDDQPATDQVDKDDHPGGELVVRPDDDLETWQPGQIEPWQDTRPTLTVRQRTNRGRMVVITHPATLRATAFTVQLPRATLMLAVYTPRGTRRLAGRFRAWLGDHQSLELMAKHAEAKEGDQHTKVSEARAARVATRRTATVAVVGLVVLVASAWWWPQAFAGLLATLTFLAVLALARGVCRNPQELVWVVVTAGGLAGLAWWLGPDLANLAPRPPAWLWLSLFGVAVLVCGLAGRREDEPLISKPATMVAHKPPPITAPMVIDALVALGNSKMKEPEDVKVIMDPHQAGDGVQLDLELPKSVPASWVVKNREPLAAAMRQPLGCVWPAVGVRHPGHFSLYISEQPMAEARQKPWPLADGGAVDIFKPLPLVTNQRGDWVDLVLAYASMVIGAQPRMGKTFFLRECLLVAGLEVRCKVAAMDGKGTGDLSPTRLFADFYSVGDDPEEIEDRVLPFLRGLRAEMRRRAKFIRDLPHDQAPESKVTSELVDRYPHLAPWVVGMDETQSYFGYGDKKNPKHKAIRDEIIAIVTDLVKRGPALGMWMEVATQNVSEETIPRPISLNAVIRAALKLFDDSANNMVLGAGAYGKGVDATQFDFSEKGLMWLRGDGDRPFIGRSVVGLDMVASERLAAKARALRLRAGTLSGEAAGDGTIEAEVVISIEQDIEQVLLNQGRDRAQYPELVEALRELRPDVYADLDVNGLSGRMRSVPQAKELTVDDTTRIARDQVWSNGGNGRGIRLVDLRKRGGR